MSYLYTFQFILDREFLKASIEKNEKKWIWNREKYIDVLLLSRLEIERPWNGKRILIYWNIQECSGVILQIFLNSFPELRFKTALKACSELKCPIRLKTSEKRVDNLDRPRRTQTIFILFKWYLTFQHYATMATTNDSFKILINCTYFSYL